MRRANNTIPRKEYNKLLADAMIKARKMISSLMDEEEEKMRKADNQQRYEKAEYYDFNARALMKLYMESYNIEEKLRETLKQE